MGGLTSLIDAFKALGAWIHTGQFADYASFQLALVFGWSAASKFVNPTLATTALARFGIRVSRPVLAVRALAAAEVAIAVLLAAGTFLGDVAQKSTLLSSAVLLLLLGSLVASALFRKQAFPCGCFGSSADISWWHVVLDFSLATLAVVGLIAGHGGSQRLISVLIAASVAGIVTLLNATGVAATNVRLIKATVRAGN